MTPIDTTQQELVRKLVNAVEGEVRFGEHDRGLYATDASIYQQTPLGVVVPASPEDAVRAVAFCREHRLPMLPRGGGTSLAGQCTAEAVVIDVSASCCEVLELDTVRRRCRVEPGITIDDLNDLLRPAGLCFAPDPSTARQANVGGAIGNNAAGVHSILYGRTSENVAGIDACLSTGERVRLEAGAAARDPVAARLTERVVDVVRRHERPIRERFPRTLRRSAGYQLDVILDQLDRSGGRAESVDLSPLLCGSEGTLAFTLGAELILRQTPRARGLAVIAFDDLDRAIDAVVPLLELGPAGVELLDDLIIELARGNIEQRRNVELLPAPAGASVRAVLYVEFFGSEAPEVEASLEAVRQAFGDAWVQTTTDGREMARAWALRKAGEPLLHAIPGHRKPLGFVEDNAVPPERLGAFVRGFRSIVEREGTRASFYAHASVGVLHVRPLLDLRSTEDRAAMHRIAEAVAELARSLGGVMSGEHGDGKARGPLLEAHFGPELMEAFGEVKRAFDPLGLLNPGNIVAPRELESISSGVRVNPSGAPVAVPVPDTYFDYSDQTDFAHAVEMCNGAGVCRKKAGGTMCPSYMALLDERHSTRGRGNALRLAITGQLGTGAAGGSVWRDPDTLETLELCLSCKACKAECPSNVDVARLKSEYLAQGYRDAGRVPLQARAFGRVHRINRLASLAPGVANWLNGLGAVKAWNERVLGVDRRRSIPRYARPLRKRWGADARWLDRDAPVVVLLADTFTMHNEPEIGLAARRVLEAFGYRVRLESATDMGRAPISVGLLDEAIADADRQLGRWGGLIADGAIAGFVVCEPSCLSAIKDDWLSLRCRTPLDVRRRLAERSYLVEQFLEARWDDHPRRPEFGPVPGRLLLHGHCHQKALWGAESSAALLCRLFGDRVEVLDAGCCGMAGSFGYASDRYELSMAIGELALLPAVRRAGQDDVVVAPGTSCRHQIHDGTGRTAVHPVELLGSVLGAK